MNRKNEFNKESKRKQNRETTRGEGAALQKTDNNLTINEVVVNYEECGTSGLSCDGEVGNFVMVNLDGCCLLQYFLVIFYV